MSTAADLSQLETLASQAGQALRAKGHLLVTAESCTGGWIAATVTALAGSSEWFERGFVTYSNAAKQESLGVPEGLIEAHGAVSQAVAEAMARGALAHSRADVAVAVTGIAGPTGGTEDKPVGLVWLAWAWRSEVGATPSVRSERQLFSGDRQAVRAATVAAALAGLMEPK